MGRTSVILATLATCGLLCLITATASAVPFLQVTANHVGGGQIVYTLEAVNDLGGAIAVQITASGNINQVPSILFPDNPPDGGFDVLSQGGGFPPAPDVLLGPDSWWDDTDLFDAVPPFNTVLAPNPFPPPDFLPIADGAVGGFVGSTQFSYSASSAAGSNITLTRIGQMVINDAAAAGLPLGPTPVNTSGGFGQLDIIDVFNVGPGNLPAPSLIAAAGQSFSITGSFFVPEPSSIALMGVGFLALVVLVRRR